MTLIAPGRVRHPATWGRMTMSPCPQAYFEFGPHVGEVQLQLHGMTIAAVLEQAGIALGELLAPAAAAGPEKVEEVSLTAPDRSALLVEWINELLYLADRDHWIPTHFDFHDATEHHVNASVRGPVLAEAPTEVKAATWHGLRFDVRDGAFVAEVVLDV